MRIGVITPLFPTSQEPYRGLAIWNTVRALQRYAEITAYCVHPRYPRYARPRSYRYQHHPSHILTSGVVARPVTYYAVPGLTRIWNVQSIYRALKPKLIDAKLDVLLSYWIGPEGCAAVRIAKDLCIPAILGARGTDLGKRHANPLISRQICLALAGAGAVLCVSKDLAEKAAGIRGSTERIFTIPNGVDHSVFHVADNEAIRKRLGIPLECKLALFVGWLSNLKGILHTVQALGILHNSEQGRWRMAVIGEGSLGAELSREVARLGLTEHVFLLGPKAPHEVAEWMQASDVLCLPSETEGCPNVVLESLSVGTPVLATRVGGIPELVTEDCAVLIPSRHPAEIASGLRRIAERKWHRSSIARRHARGWDDVALETYRVCKLVRASNEDGTPFAHETISAPAFQ